MNQAADGLLRSPRFRRSWLIASLLPLAAALAAVAGARAEVSVRAQGPLRLTIVHADHLAEAAREWAAYRAEQGWGVDVLPMGEVTNRSASAQAAAEALQAELRRRYENASQSQDLPSGRFFVLLLGDVHARDGGWALPTFHRPQDDPVLVSRGSEPEFATDHPYRLKDDRDDRPDFPLGRVPAETVEEARAVLAKIRRYEHQAEPGPWRRRLTFAASEGRFGPIDRLLESQFKAMIERVVPYRFDVTMTYANPESPYCPAPSRLNEALLDDYRDGALMWTYVGHGMPSGLDYLYWRGAAIPICTIQDVERMELDGVRNPIAVLIACSTGWFDLPHGRRSLAEAMLFHDQGPIGVIGGSRITHPYANAIYLKDLMEQVTVHARTTLGAVDLGADRALFEPDEADLQMEVLAGGMALAQGWVAGPAELRVMHAGLYNLLGDPATLIAHPHTGIVDLAHEAGVVTGRIEGATAACRVRVTLESTRTAMPFRGLMKPILGRDDPDLEGKAAWNYRWANEKVLASGQGTVDEDGRFRIELDWVEELAGRAVESRGSWIKVYVEGVGMGLAGAMRLGAPDTE